MEQLYTRYRAYARTVSALIQADMVNFKSTFFSRLIDTCIAVFAQLIVMGSILPAFGLAADFGPFMLGGLIVSVSMFQAYPIVATLVSDMAGDRKMVSYLFTLPMPSWLAFVQMIISLALRGAVLSFCMLILGKLYLGAQLPVQHISFVGCFIMITVASIFCATLGVWISSMIKDMSALSSVWTRFMFPLWIFGGFQFSWAALHKVYPLMSYLGLANPLLYATEGLRNAMLSSGSFIPLWICVPVLILFSFLCSWWGIMRLKKRLDFV